MSARASRLADGGPRLAPWARVAIVLLALAIVAALRVAVNEPTVGVSFLSLVPIILAARWFGRSGALVVALIAVLQFVVGEVVRPQSDLLPAVALRLVVFCSVALLFARLDEERGQLRAAVRAGEQELDELRAIQSALVPAELPDRPALDIASCFVPAQGGVAGDFFLVAEGPSESTLVVVGDVLGKGLNAARRAAFVRTALLTFAPFTDNPCRLLEMANSSLIEKAGTSETFVTAVCASFSPRERKVSWAVAGHPPPMRLDDAVTLNGARPGIPLGIDVDVQCQVGELPLGAGGGVMLFTDGLIEARRAAREEDAEAPIRSERSPVLGIEAVEELVVRLRGESPAHLVRALQDTAESFSGGSLPDDLCIVALRATD